MNLMTLLYKIDTLLLRFMRASKVDNNQAEIVAAFRGYGCTVHPLHTVGKGFPDLVVGFRGRNLLVEVKDGDKAKLTPDQIEWHKKWFGQVAIVRSIMDVEILLGVTP